MNLRRTTGGFSSPVLVGAITVLVVGIAVFLSYNANAGLPFVPTYEVSVRLPDAAELVPGNDVRQGGSRVGAISDIEAVRTEDSAYSVVKIKINRESGPLPADTRAYVRQRSSLGLKYLEIVPGRSGEDVAQGAVLPNRGSVPAVDLDDVLDTLDEPTRRGLTQVIDAFGSGTAGRGGALNRTLEDLPPVLERIVPVADNLASPETNLGAFVRALGDTFVGVSPVRTQIAPAMSAAARTFEALDDRPALQGTLETAAATLRPATEDMRASLAGIAETRDLLTRLRPAARELPATSRALGAALDRLTPPLVASRRTFAAADPALDSVRTLVRDPTTSSALRQLTRLTGALEPALTYINPWQTQCNYLGLWTRNVPNFISEGDTLGTWFRALPVLQSEEILTRANPSPILHYDPYPDAGQGGTCEGGQQAYVNAGRQVIGPNGLKSPSTTELTSRPPEVLGR